MYYKYVWAFFLALAGFNLGLYCSTLVPHRATPPTMNLVLDLLVLLMFYFKTTETKKEIRYY